MQMLLMVHLAAGIAFLLWVIQMMRELVAEEYPLCAEHGIEWPFYLGITVACLGLGTILLLTTLVGIARNGPEGPVLSMAHQLRAVLDEQERGLRDEILEGTPCDCAACVNAEPAQNESDLNGRDVDGDAV